MRIVTKADAGQWIKATNAWERTIAKTETLAVRAVGKEALKAGRDAITAAGFSTKFANSLVMKNIPSSGYVLDPAVYIHSTINYADIFERGATIAGKPYLWLPLPDAPAGHNGRPHLTPKQYIAEIGPLVLMWRPGKPPMLGRRMAVSGAARPSATPGSFRRRRSSAQQYQTVPLYVGVPSVSIPSKFAVHSKFAEIASEENIQEAMTKYEEKYIDPNGSP